VPDGASRAEGFLSESESYPAGTPDVRSRRLTLRSGLHVRVVEAGPVAGPGVLLLPGWAASAYLFHRNIPALAAAGLHALTVDIKGHGWSDKPRERSEYTLPSLVSHALEAMDALQLDRAMIVGQSLGGAIATGIYFHSPERVTKLALIAPAGFGSVRPVSFGPLVLPRVLDPITARVLPRWLVALVLRLASGTLEPPTERDIDEYRAPARDSAYVRGLVTTLREVDWRELEAEQVANILVPLLVIFGSADRFISPTHFVELVRKAPRGTPVLLPGAGHIPNDERPDEVNRLLIDFLLGREGDGSAGRPRRRSGKVSTEDAR